MKNICRYERSRCEITHLLLHDLDCFDLYMSVDFTWGIGKQKLSSGSECFG